MGWRQFVMELESLEPERVEEIFAKHGAQAVTLQDAGDDAVLEPAPGETPLWSDTSITGLFDAQTDLEPMKQELCDVFSLTSLPRSHVELLEDRVWEREWLRDFKPMRFGERLWVSPHDADVPAEDAIVIRLDPGLAFGTGTHATTALCLEWLASTDLAGTRVVDLGCGSGILGIGALLLGARSVQAIDIDAQALTATRENAAANGVGGQLMTLSSLTDVTDECDVMLANILAEPLIELAPAIAATIRPGGRLALSGILEDQADDVVSAYEDGFELQPTGRLCDGWVRVCGIRRGV